MGKKVLRGVGLLRVTRRRKTARLLTYMRGDTLPTTGPHRALNGEFPLVGRIGR